MFLEPLRRRMHIAGRESSSKLEIQTYCKPVEILCSVLNAQQSSGAMRREAVSRLATEGTTVLYNTDLRANCVVSRRDNLPRWCRLNVHHIFFDVLVPLSLIGWHITRTSPHSEIKKYSLSCLSPASCCVMCVHYLAMLGRSTRKSTASRLSVLRDVRYHMAKKAKNTASDSSTRAPCARNYKILNGLSVFLKDKQSFSHVTNRTWQQPTRPP